MRKARAALALLLAFAVPVRAETTTDPLWYLLSTVILAPDAAAVEAPGDGPADAKGLAALQADLLVLTDGLEGFRDEAQVQDTLERLKPRMSPELRPFFKDRSSSLDAIYRTLAITDYTWALRFPEPPCEPGQARRRLLAGRDGLFQDESGAPSPWLLSLLGPQTEGTTAEQALDQASSLSNLTGAEYEKLRARVRNLTMALASHKAVGPARSRLYCSRAAAFADLAAAHREKDANLISAGRGIAHKPEESVFVVVWKGQRAAATLLKTKDGSVLVTDASVVADTDHPGLFAYSANAKPIEFKATVVRRQSELGVAVLTFAKSPAGPALRLADQAPEKDELVTAIGHTTISGLWTKTSGLVTKAGEISFQTDAAISPELSGGPVLNDAGEVTGMLVLRPADTEEGRWPVAIPAPILARWLEDPSYSVAAGPVESIEDDGTAAILTRARPSALTEAGLGAWNIPSLPPPPPTPRGVCVANCGGSRSSGSSYSSGFTGNGGEELGKALGELGAVLILKGIPALFRGIGKLFKDRDRSSNIAQTKPASSPKPKVRSKKPAPPPPPAECRLKSLSAPKVAGEVPFEISVQLSCDDPKVKLSGYPVTFSVSLDSGTLTKAKVVYTDNLGIARFPIQIANEEVAVHKVKTTAERFHDDLDEYAREMDSPADLMRDPGLTEAASPTTIEKAATTAVIAKNARSASKARKVFTVARAVRHIRVVGVIGGVATGGISLVVSMIATEVIFALGEKALGAHADGQDSRVAESRSDDDPCEGLREQLNAHIRKLQEYIDNPHGHDNKGFLGQGRDEKVIEGRKRSLQKQIRNFRSLLEECERLNEKPTE
ncbi:MAG: serine protease [Elusimicrobiota bacterium]|nr:serine protease [Elusimicrobiota bacterium]